MMSKIVVLVFSLLGLFSACVGQFVQLGQCDPNVELVPDFDAEKFLGTWYELIRSDNPDQRGECAELQLTNTSNTINVRHSSVVNNFFEDANGTATFGNGTATLTLRVSSYENPINLSVLLTDYETFALTYSCENITTSQRRVHIWVLSRQRSFPNEMMPALINTTINNTFGIDGLALKTVQHTVNDCYILPIIEPGQPIILPGQCDPNLPTVQNFDVTRFIGTWHEIASYQTANSDGTCIRAQYSVAQGLVYVLNSQVKNMSLLTIDGYASINSTDGSGKLSVILNIEGVPVPQELWILATDYDNYAISYSCANLTNNEKRVFSWIISRTRQLPTSFQPQVDEVVNSILDLNYLYYEQTNQTDAGCFFYPEPVPNTPVVFRGQCNTTNIDAMANFDAVRYMGLWHNIELYPAPFQGGNCSNAFYEFIVEAGRVDVLNTQVINQTLDTVNAVAVPVSTDGSAKLVVTFPVAGTNITVSTDYWVLDTDYDSYALVYSCFNMNADEMQVGTWKLSRTKQLPLAAQTAISRVLDTALVLDQRYFEVMDQSDESCFYYPEPQPGVPVVFPGQCDETIPVVQNFNFAQFQGTWYEVQAYPKAEQPGQCINHQYSFVNSSRLNLVSSYVDDQFLGITNGVLSNNTNDNSGKLVITITDVNGTAINIPFWILSTDYNEYALAYSCVNISADFQGVWSWKLSRAKQLSTAANTAINTSITNINVPVLGNQYFEDIDQSDWACYSLPDLQPGDPIVIPGQCNTTMTGVPNFNATRFVGRWRLVEGYASNFQVGTCNVAEYTLVNANTIGVTNSQVVNQELATITGTGTITSTDGSGRITVTFPSNGQSFEYYVLDTDYDSYALGYGCVNLENNQRRVYSWKLSRQNTLSQSATNNINQVINSIDVLNNRFYYTVNRTEAGCFYFPTPNSESRVRFRGQCNQSIPVVTNFDAARYLGLWHDIESYPVNFQDGTCNNAFYSPGNDVGVFNTQVINQTLFSISGSASLVASTDGSAKLNVTFNLGGNVTTNYWVLATDYESYAFVYNCENVDDEYLQVATWKLSRTKALTPAASTAINNVMNTIPILDQRYFVARNQSPEGCFYYPEPQLGMPVVFPGQCDDNIAAVPNFNMSLFGGLWHEIEAYPKDEQPGQCINHQFTVNGTNTYLQSSNVVSQTLGLTDSIVTFSSTDGSGRLVITISSDNGTAITIPYWVLSTDYSNYALAYSCVNISSDFRGIWSWKLSRTKELSPTSSVAIDNAISNINVLDNVYYEDIDQTERACFYLPEIAPGETVILPGQCDTNITGIANFNLTRYAGRWRLVESYESGFQTGTCNTARYTVENSTTLGVTNEQVVDQELRTISGSATISSTDGSGKLLFTFPSTLAVYEIYILDTDYDSYALGYGCVNVDNETRSVRSWKLSRDDTLSQTATNNINRIIDSIEVLHQPYYYPVNRTESGCFYFPTPNANSTVRFRGQCDETIPVVNNFDVGRYLGLWHDIESYPVPFQDGSCPNAYYAPYNSTTVTVFNTHVVENTLGVINGLATVAFTDGSAKLNVTFNVLGFNVTTNYWVLATDYDNYAFVYSCANIDDEYKSVASWKLSRTKALTPASTTAINNIMNNYNILDQSYYINRNQSPEGCFYYPEPQLGVPVVFPGQCDDNIAAVPNFNMSLFGGLWHEIEAYPKDEQPGQCINHQFTVNGTNTYLQSSNVVSQSLGLTDGIVTFSSTDGSGRLVITISSDNGTAITIPYWVLSTDYSNYALAYSCVNISSDFRGIWSWKLSRTKELSPAASVAIDNAISNINVLNNVYYEDIDQTDRACFYLPEIAPGETVILPGQCDTNITGIANFNLTRYAGRWRLVESYESRFQTGTCNTARYTVENSTTLGVTNEQVVDQELRTISGSATISSTDGSGKLLFTFPSRVPVYEIYILDTDYDSYALGYGCVNVDNETRSVRSWKFSRDDTLSQTATNNINRIIDSIEVLHQPYYYPVNRTESGCFYFPTPNANSTVRFRGQCDETIPVVNNFDVGRYLGLWHDIESYPVPFQDGSCPNAYYAPYNSTTVTVFNTHVVENTLGVINGLATVAFTDGSAKLNVTFNVLGFNVTTNYWVLATDYDNYAFVYSCANIDDEYKSVASWKLSRTKALTPASTTAINNIMNNYNILDQSYYINRNQSAEGCFYFPEPELGVPVVFPGQCDETIAAVPSFSMNAFQGVWHEIAAYPKDEQPGQCVSHQFQLNSTNTLHLDTFNVLNQSLSATEGQVSFNTTDGSGKLVITIIADGQLISIPYWILSTDYSNYALAYSCVNINSDYRGVWSWKLSRTKQLTAAANTAINNAIANINVLDNQYYEDIQQTDDACFYLPELGPTDPVIFPGQCDTNIPVFQNFNASRYLGRWRLIESYYTAFQDGTCNTAEYSAASDGSVIVFNTKVVDEQLNTITGSAVLATTDGSAKLTVTFPNSPAPMDYWILDTDYDSYALVYTCQNINTSQRRVWSWKLSRTNTLTTAATNAINQIVNSVEVLNDRFYQTVNRTDVGCFYYPTPDSDSTTIFPGQCNESIPAVPNFNPALYAGQWYDVESYPTPFQSGTCNRALYTLTSGGTVNVENTQVVNQLLQTMTGTAVVASTDASAKLNVTFNLSSGSVTTNYWVLATDYTSYSLVYSCRNIDAESRAVYSWKLGRQPSIPAAAATAINNVLNTVQVLDSQYFVQRNHTENGCFYYPDNNGGDVILNGQCLPDAQVPAINNFNTNAWPGTWHEVARFPSTIQTGECGNTQYSLAGNNAFTVFRTSVINETLESSTLQATVPTNGRGVISANIDGVPFNDVYILATDYTEYALAYACRNLSDNTKQVYSWKLGRSRAGLSTAANNVIDQIVNNNIDLHERYYRYTAQDDAACFHYPDFEQLPEVIELTGPCNTSVRAVANFNAVAYLGRWYEVARYPQRAQTGQCNRAEYSPGTGNAVSVVNSQVVNSTLATISGTAVSVGSDGLLQVTFVVGGETRIVDYYVLATDYSNYALVYTCTNLANGNRQVGSWKLSRTTTLSAQAYSVMEAVINGTQGLREDYYQSTSQSDDSCFYVPEVNPEQAPIFRGQCEDITGMAGFNVNSYLGWWHEIETYPVDDGLGVCTSSRYEAVGNTIQVVDTSISDLSAVTVSGTATITTDGRIRRVFNNRVQDIWVLATDYDTYALLYSCENVNSEYRRVWSAKHSKARSLTQAAEDAMAPLITNNRLLHPQFYQTVNQTNSACFHYPTQDGAEVVLSGNCDLTIPVVQNFNMGEFQGTWYQIERYYAVGNSTCVSTGAVYNATSGYINVVTTEVVSGQVSTVSAAGELDANDGSARISLVLPGAGTNGTSIITIYILATDYKDYALAYSCDNIDPFHRQVRAWQLSRSRTLSDEGAAVIRSVVNQREELHEPYFNQISQTGCPEPSSAFFIKSSIIVMLICALLQLVL